MNQLAIPHCALQMCVTGSHFVMDGKAFWPPKSQEMIQKQMAAIEGH
jgi:hypothetical protein